MVTGPDGTFRLGPWTVRPRLGQIAGPGGELHLEPKVMGVLTCLAENAGDVVTRDELVARVWHGRMVSDEVLSRCISQLRTRLGDNPREPEYIRTVPKIGYQLLKAVAWDEAPPALDDLTETAPDAAATAVEPPESVEPRAPPRSRLPWGVLAVAIAALAGVLLMRGNDDAGVEEDAARPALAVLPFTTLGDDPQNDYLGDGLTEDLINHLANLPGLQVVASTSAFAFKDRAADVRDIARELGVRHVLQGSVRKDGDRVRITAALTDAGSGLVQWSRSFDTAFSDIFSVQDEISKGIVDELGPRFGGKPSMPETVRVPTNVMPAYERVLRGRHHLRSREEASLLRSIELFSEAIEFDPHFGEAYRDLARAYALLPTYSYEDPSEMFDLSEAALEQGVAMDPSLDEEVYDVRAFLHYSRWEWSAAEEDFRRALEHTPNDPNLHQWYSQQLAAVGKPELALEAVLQAKALDVLSPTINQRLAVVYQWVDDDEKAYQQFELASELGLGPRANPESYVIQLLRRGDYKTARELLLDLQRAFRRASHWVDPFIAALKDPARRPDALGALRAVADERQISVKYLQGALVYLGDADGALDVAFELLNEPLDFEVEFLFARENAIVRQHPRFGELVRAIGLDDYWDDYGWPEFCNRDGDSIICR